MSYCQAEEVQFRYGHFSVSHESRPGCPDRDRGFCNPQKSYRYNVRQKCPQCADESATHSGQTQWPQPKLEVDYSDAHKANMRERAAKEAEKERLRLVEEKRKWQEYLANKGEK